MGQQPLEVEVHGVLVGFALQRLLIGHNELAQTIHHLMEDVGGNETIAQHFFLPLCPWSRRTASVLPLSSGIPPSAPRTGQVAFTTSGGPIPAASAFSHILHAVGSESLVLSLWFFLCPEWLDPFPLCPALPDSLDGRDSVENYGSAAPLLALPTYPPTLCREPGRFRRCSHSNFSISLRYFSVILETCEQAREACLRR